MSRVPALRTASWSVAVLALLVLPTAAGAFSAVGAGHAVEAAPAPQGPAAFAGPFASPAAAGGHPVSPAVAAPPGPLSASLPEESTLTLYNGSLWHGNTGAGEGTQPSWEVFDPQSDEVFITDFYSASISVVSASTHEVVAVVPAPIYPDTIAYDPVNGDVYVGLQTYDSVEIIDGLQNTVVGNISVGLEVLAMAADPVTGNMFVVGENSTFQANVTVLSGSTGAVLTSFALANTSFPEGIAYNPANSLFYVITIVSGVPQGTEGNVTLVNAPGMYVVGNISLLFNPDAILYVPPLQSFYLSDSTGNSLAILNGTTNLVTGTITGPNTPGILAYATDGNVYVGTFPNTVTVVDANTATVTTSFFADRGPDGFAFDSLDGSLYVTDYVWANVTVYNTTSNDVVATVLLAVQPYAMTYDPTNGDEYILDHLSEQIFVVEAATAQVVGTIPYGLTSFDIAYDPVTGDLYGTDYTGTTSGNISVVNLTQDEVTGYLPVGDYPWGLACDPTTGDLYVADASSNNVTVVDPSTGKSVASIPTDTEPLEVAFDAAKNAMVVSDYIGSNVTVIDAATNVAVANVTVGPYSAVGPWALTADDPAGDIFVANTATDNVTVINGTTLTTVANISVGEMPNGIDYDPLDRAVYVANDKSNDVTVINATSHVIEETVAVGQSPIPVAYDPADGAVLIGNYNGGSLTLLPPSYPVQFTESGLAVGTNWSVNVSGTLWTTNRSALTLYLPNGTVASYVVIGPNGTFSTPASGMFTVAGTKILIALAFSTDYTVTFTEFGLPSGQAWSVDLAGQVNASTSSSIGFLEGDSAGLSFSIGGVPGFLAVPSSGAVAVSDANVSEIIEFQRAYPLTFVEQGLPTPFSWSVDFNGTANGSSTADIGFSAVNETGDTYAVVPVPGFTAHPARGVAPIDGGPSTVTILFVPAYAVTFTETGLPAGTVWGVDFNNTANSSTSTSIVYFVPNGTGYTYQVSSTNRDYFGTPSSGSFDIQGGPQQVAIVWSLRPVATYQITFVDGGLPAGTSWQVTLLLTQPVTLSTTGTRLAFTEGNGTYAFSIAQVLGYNSTPELGSIVVDGANVTRDVNFTAVVTPPPPGTNASAGISDTEIAVIVGGLIAIAVVGVLAYVWTRKSPKGPPGGARPPVETDESPP